MHYDANNNLLFVLKGSKRVALVPPNMSAGVEAMPVRKRVGATGNRQTASPFAALMSQLSSIGLLPLCFKC